VPWDPRQIVGATSHATTSNERLRGCFVTGTDTGVGKTVVAAAIVARLRQQGQPLRALKPLITGLDEPPDTDWPPDHELLARVSDQRPDEVMLHGFGPPVSPHLAAELARVSPPSIGALTAEIRAATPAGSVAIVEGVGGLLVPISPSASVLDLAVALELPLILVARPGLGTINHTLLTVQAARTAGLRIAGIVMTPWPAQPDAMVRSNRDTIERLAKIPVVGLPFVASAEPGLLAAAARSLPLKRWLGI
jgi:dethiobiotin synthetase